MNECHASVGAGTRFRIDELRFSGGQRGEIPAEVCGSKADMVQPLSVACQETGDAARVIGRLDELNPGRGLRPGSKEDHPHSLVRHLDRPLDRLQTEQLAVPRHGLLDRTHDHGDVVDRTEACRWLVGGRHGRYSPHTDRNR